MPEDHPPNRVLVLCTANRCRSVMAAALLADRLGAADATLVVRSAGVGGSAGERPPPEVIAVLAGYGLDVSRHRSRIVSAAELDSASLVLAMAREHARHAAVAAVSSWPRVFTFKELIRRADQVRPRRTGESLADWLAVLNTGRDRFDLLGEDPADDVADPIGGPLAGYAAAAAEIDQLVRKLAGLGWGWLTGELPGSR